MTTRVVHVNSQKWKDTPEDQRVYIGRRVKRGKHNFEQSFWCNHFRIVKPMTREDAIAAYERSKRTIMFRPHPHLIHRLRAELRGKVLGCWCHPEPCHGDVLARLADMTDPEFEEWLTQ